MSAALELEQPTRRHRSPRRHRRPKRVCTCGVCRSCGMRRAWAEGRYDGRNPNRRMAWDAWTHEEEELLRQLAGTMTATEIGKRITERCGVLRTQQAIWTHARVLGVSLWIRGDLSQRDVRVLFGVSLPTIRGWVDGGHLVARRVGRDWRFRIADLGKFIETCPHLYDYQRMEPGHRLTALAQVVARRRAWIGAAEAARLLNCSASTVRRWLTEGRITGVRLTTDGPGGWRIPLAAVIEARRERRTWTP